MEELIFKACKYCSGDPDDRPFLDSRDLYIDENGALVSADLDVCIAQFQYCPRCGRPLTKETQKAENARLRELIEADRDGRLVIRPVKLGTPVWSSVICRIDDDGVEHPTYPWKFSDSMLPEWGAGWHLTESDALKALEDDSDIDDEEDPELEDSGPPVGDFRTKEYHPDE